ncbi:MAG: YihY/virulence factor BrkB family protein [Chloroflexota bacterium]|nr:YihY/virulence factor BrkB family protein [Chloroflexota bacterium]
MKRRLSLIKQYRRKAKLKELFYFMKEVVDEFLTDNCTHLSASISYYAFFSIFPLTLAFISILGILSSDPEVEIKVIDTVGKILPVSSEDITSTIRSVSGTWGATGIVAIIGLLWGGSAVFNAIRKSLNAAWGVRTPRPFLVERLMELSMMMGVGILLLLSFGITAAVHIAQNFSVTFVGSSFFGGDFFWNAMLVLLTTVLTFVTILVLYRLVPNTRVRWRDIWGGALLAAAGFEGVKQVFVWYATTYAHYNLIYGSVGTIIALMVWIYFSAVIFLFCAKLTSVYSRRRFLFFQATSWKGRRKVRNRIRPSFDSYPELGGSSEIHRSEVVTKSDYDID